MVVEEVVPIVETKLSDSIENLLHTAIIHICDQIALVIKIQEN